MEFKKRVADSLDERYTPDKQGFQFQFDNDWDLHLYALVMNQQGKSKDEARNILLALPLTGIPSRKKVSYVEDVLNSIIVGYEHGKEALPIYTIVGGA